MTSQGLPEESARQQAATQAEPGTATADDKGRLQEEIERTREQLGETVEQLAAKADVKTMARAKKAELTGRAKSTTASTAARARRAAASGSRAAREYRAPLVLAAVAVITGWLGAREWRKPAAGWRARPGT